MRRDDNLFAHYRKNFFAHYIKATLHRRIFFLIGGAMIVNGVVAMVIAHAMGVDVHNRTRGAYVLAFFVLMLWGVSGKIARRLTLPFVELARVAQEIGRGNLSARYAFHRHGRTREAFLIGYSINEMVERIEKQLKDQRELLASVSHEVRTPLARIRMLVELARGREQRGEFIVDAKTLDDLDREVMEIDALVGELLASSRLDFAALTCTELEAADVARRALERQTLSPTLTLPDAPLAFRADPTLVQRALANLLQNAVVHAGGVDAFVVKGTGDTVRFEVKDRGPGLAEGEETKVFESFYRGSAPTNAPDRGHAALGLGLALVERIAKAHGGRAFAERRTDGPGACIGIELPRRGPAVTLESAA
jgi:two-component system, OmpR family, sensor kinase